MIAPIEVSPSSMPGHIKVIRVSKGARKQIVFCLTDDSGQPVDLKKEVQNPPADAADFSPQAAATGSNVKVRMRTESGELNGSSRFDLEGKILDQTASRGFVEFILTNNDTKIAGIFEAYIERYVDGDNIVDTWPLLIAIEPAAMSLLDANPSGPLLIPEIRLALYDTDNQTDGAPFSNLLDDTEFSDLDIIFAMRRVVQLWNETPPPVSFYTPQNFPYRYWWLKATCAELMLMSASRYRRNRLAYNAGGVSIDDQSKSDEYETIGRTSLKEFMDWMRAEKYRINMELVWATGL
jgi:hypothetical protein